MKQQFLKIIVIVGVTLSMACSSPQKKEHSGFVKVDKTQFLINGEPYNYVGTNFWYGAYLGMAGEKGDRERLKAELDILVENGITNLRVLGASEESEFENSLKPTILKPDGSYNEELLVGLDYLLAEMAKRDMKAVIFLNNYWEWSGGMMVYNSWYGDGPIVDPADGDWEAYMYQVAQFYKNEKAQEAYRKYIQFLINRTNTITNYTYSNDPTIMSWQLANEPRPGRGARSIADIPVYIDWVDKTAGFIKSLDSNHLVSTGSEGEIGSLDSMEVFVEAHKSPNIDYLTFHMWAKNWGWFKADDMEGTFPNTIKNAKNYITSHVSVAEELQKPIVLEEFGLGRDYESTEQGSSVEYRNKYYAMVFDMIENNAAFAGSNFWSWGGLGSKQHEDAKWRVGDPFTGDPPQEPQGLNSVFATDSSTLAIIKKHAHKLNKN